jgi:thymidylate synthase
MVAQVCGLKPKEFVHVMGDVHIYKTHVEGLKEQIKRVPLKPATLRLNPDIKSIYDFKVEDIMIENYVSHEAIKLEMAI